MSQSPVARRYAKALFEQAETNGSTERVDADMVMLRQAMADSRELVLLFESPVISRDQKRATLHALLAEKVDPLTLDMVELMVEKGRGGDFADVAVAFREMRHDQLGIVEAQVRTPRAMTADDERTVIDRLSILTGKKVKLEVTLDLTLIGGIVVRVGDTVYDGSVSNKLANLRERLMYGTTVN